MAKTIIVARRFDESRQLYRYLKDFGRMKETFYIQEANLLEFVPARWSKEDKLAHIKSLLSCGVAKERGYELVELTQSEYELQIEKQKALFMW